MIPSLSSPQASHFVTLSVIGNSAYSKHTCKLRVTEKVTKLRQPIKSGIRLCSFPFFVIQTPVVKN